MVVRFEDFEFDAERRELRRAGKPVPLGPQVFDLLQALIRQGGRVISKDELIVEVWRDRIVSDSTITSHVNALRKALGDSGQDQRLVRTVPRKGFRFDGSLTTEEEIRPQIDQQGSPSDSLDSQPHQSVQFCRTHNGTSIAFATVGKGLPLIKTANWLNHLEYDWESPIWRALFTSLSTCYRLTRYDARGNGLSDWDVTDFSLKALTDDLEAVVEASRQDRFSLFAMSQGCAVAVNYAIRHPQRVTHLVLYGGFVRGKRRRGSQADIEQADALLTLMRDGWGNDNPAFRQVFTARMIPGGTLEQFHWMNELQKRTTSPENAVALRRSIDNIDLSDLLPLVSVPTLVMHVRDDAVQPFEEGRKLATSIPGARFVALEGNNHLPLPDDPSWNRLQEEIAVFVGGGS